VLRRPAAHSFRRTNFEQSQMVPGALVLLMFTTSLYAAGAVRGKVLGPDNLPLSGVLVEPSQ